MGGVVARKDRDGAIGDAFNECVDVPLGAQRRVHLEVRVKRADGFVGKRDVVRADFATERDAAGTGLAQDPDAASAAEVLAMDGGAAGLSQKRVALDNDFLADGGPAGESQHRADVALVHDSLADEVVVLAMVHDGQSEHAGVLEGAPHEFVVLDATPVVGEGDDAGFVHGTDGSEFLACEPLGDCSGREHVHAGLGPGLFSDPCHHAGVVHGGRGVGHADHAGESSGGGGPGARGDGFLGRLAWFTQVNVQINQARGNHKPSGVNRLGWTAGGQGRKRGNFSVEQKQVAFLVNVVGGIQNASVADQGAAHGKTSRRRVRNAARDAKRRSRGRGRPCGRRDRW